MHHESAGPMHIIFFDRSTIGRSGYPALYKIDASRQWVARSDLNRGCPILLQPLGSQEAIRSRGVWLVRSHERRTPARLPILVLCTGWRWQTTTSNRTGKHLECFDNVGDAVAAGGWESTWWIAHRGMSATELEGRICGFPLRYHWVSKNRRWQHVTT